MKTGKITLLLGPMFSGKSSILLNEIDKAMIAKIPCCIVRPKTDTREFFTHSKREFCICDNYNVEDLKEIPVEKYDVVCIDEGQFFKSLRYSLEWAKMGKRVYISALNGDRHQKEWETTQEMIPLADEIIFLKAVCSRCGSYEASFSYKVNDTSASQVDIGGSAESFIALCRACLQEEMAGKPLRG
jgi:thymidine kinase